MSKVLNNIIKEAYSKYKKDSFIMIKIAQELDSYIKSDEIEEVLSQNIEINIDEIESLINPEKFEFEKQKIEQIEV